MYTQQAKKMADPRVFHFGKCPSTAVYVGRPTPFGNPFRIGVDGTRAEVVARYETWLLAQPELVERVRMELSGRDLACWCAPKPCHADVLLRVANAVPSTLHGQEKL
jgi:hypothetical protein